MATCYPFFMNHFEYMEHLREHEARSLNHKPVARAYRNGAGVDELIHLPQSMWDYADWLEAEGHISMQEWVTHCEANPWQGMTLSHLIMYWLWLDNCRRYRYGEPLPDNVPPEGYEACGEAANDA